MSNKRSFDEFEGTFEVTDFPPGWIEQLVCHPEIITQLAKLAGITEEKFKKTKLTPQSFSTAKWYKIAPALGLPETLEDAMLELPSHTLPTCNLPPSFHKELYQGGWRMMDVYGEKPLQKREAARVRLLEPWLTPILAVFEGRIIDKPKQNIASTSLSSGGSVEHKVIAIGGAIFFVVELKFEADDDDNVAQLFLELMSAAKMNQKSKFPSLRVYGLLTDLTTFQFYSYDPIFSVIMCGYVEALRASVLRSKAKLKEGNHSLIGSSPTHQLTQTASAAPASPRSSLSDWEKGLVEAEKAYEKFQQKWTNFEELELVTSEGLKLLRSSVPHLPRYAKSTSEEQPIALEELEKVAEASIKRWYEKSLGSPRR